MGDRLTECVAAGGLIAVALSEGSIVRCAGCGVHGRWEGGEIINPGPGSVASLCLSPTDAPRPHGPWIPERLG